MQPTRFFYIIKLQYLGFRYHGWQKQPQLKTVERMVERTINYVLRERMGIDHRFKILACGRTDAMVSAQQTYIELFLEETDLNLDEFLPLFNKNLPQDIRALEITETDRDFNIIQNPQVKEYVYLFSFGEKNHPFAAPFMTNIVEDLEIEKMKEAALLFQGKHDFWSYTFRPSPTTQTQGEIFESEIIENKIWTANFFPDKSYVFRIKSPGFKRYQIRLMMGALLQLGKKEIDLDFIKASLEPENKIKLTYVAPASGLILNSVEFL